MLKKGNTPSEDRPPLGARFTVALTANFSSTGRKSVAAAVLPWARCRTTSPTGTPMPRSSGSTASSTELSALPVLVNLSTQSTAGKSLKVVASQLTSRPVAGSE